jgi:hypothetical protein
LVAGRPGKARRRDDSPIGSYLQLAVLCAGSRRPGVNPPEGCEGFSIPRTTKIEVPKPMENVSDEELKEVEDQFHQISIQLRHKEGSKNHPSRK